MPSGGLRCVRPLPVPSRPPSLGLVLTSPLVDAQFALRSKIEGTITDTTGATLPGATVTLTETTRNQVQVATTDDSGAYAFSNLASGIYTVGAELTGFVKAMSQPVTLGSASTTRVDLVMNVGVSETVQVVHEVPLVHTDQIAVGVAVDKALIDTIASKGRNFTSFVQLAPGISTQPRTDNAGTYSAGSHHVIGGIDYVAGGGGNNGFYVNGVNANDNYVGGQSYSPSLEAVDEIKVDVANFSAANGRDLSSLSRHDPRGHEQVSRRRSTTTSKTRRSTPGTRSIGSASPRAPRSRRSIATSPAATSADRSSRTSCSSSPISSETYNRRGDEPQFFRVPTAAERQGDFSELLSRFPDDPNYVLYNPFTTVITDDGESIREPIPEQRPARTSRVRTARRRSTLARRTC